MRFAFTEEQELLRESVRDFVEQLTPVSAARSRLEEGGYDADVWKRLATELELTALHVPEELGGHGFGYVELGVVLEELGRAVYPGPFLASAGFATPLLVAAGADAGLLAPIVGGSSVATVAFEGNGTAFRRVVNAPDADLFVLPFEDALYVVEADEATVGAVDGMDPTRPVADLVLAQPPERRIGPLSALREALPVMQACFAAELVGLAERSLELTTEYVGDREQFGVPVGSFQAVQHRCADLLVELEEARSSTYHALWAVTAGDSERQTSAAVALAFALRCAEHVTRASIQLHGGIGFTWEHDAHLFFRRAVAAPALLGPARYHLRAVESALFA